jgi:hypothetical protein
MGSKVILARSRPSRWSLLFALAAVGATAKIADASTGVTVEGVSDYTIQGGTNTDCDTEASGFLGIVGGGNGFTQNTPYYDGQVYDSDFLDPDCSGCNSNDNDTNNFDRNGTAIALLCTHGTCDDTTTNACTTSSQCGSGYCPGTPPTSASSACINNTSRRIVTSSNNDIHGHKAFYGPGKARWGEDANSGAWAGAGTNGDDNAVFMINSCAVRQPFMLSQLKPLFAGTPIINIIMPTSNLNNGKFADANKYSSRGSLLAYIALNNLNATMQVGWAAALDDTPQTDGSCPDLTNTYTYGGGHGIIGCGAHVSMSMDESATYASEDLNDMTWMNTQDESWDSLGNGYWYWSAHCNYDCNTYPFKK